MFENNIRKIKLIKCLHDYNTNSSIYIYMLKCKINIGIFVYGNCITDI